MENQDAKNPFSKTWPGDDETEHAKRIQLEQDEHAKELERRRKQSEEAAQNK